MNKKELITAVSEKLETTKKNGELVLETVLETITETLELGEDVAIAGFGKFVVTEVPERMAHNPRTGEGIPVPAHGKVSFKASSALKELVK